MRLTLLLSLGSAASAGGAVLFVAHLWCAILRAEARAAALDRRAARHTPAPSESPTTPRASR